MASPGRATAFKTEPYSWAEAHALAEELAVPEPLAIALIRRGHRTPDDATRFLEASVEHDPLDFEGMDDAVGQVLAAAGAGRRITVHGDYDVDGVCATVILVEVLRRIGAECDWVIPDRLADGYGLGVDTVRRLQTRGTSLLVTVDCGIGSREEITLARTAGIDVLVTDHHEPPDDLPDCTILHPRISGYPCAELCGAGVAHKLATAIARASESEERESADAGLDLAALATVADLVPLRDENRSLVRRGLEILRSRPRPGIRALLERAGTEPERLDEGDIAFRIAPRLNAAGRLYRADAAVELLLTDDPDRAKQVAAELESVNRERRETEAEVTRGAETALGELIDEPAELAAVILAGEEWHPGVVGIAASRIAERYWRPTILLSVRGDGTARGSGRSIPGFDLLAGLEACAQHLTQFGGHRAAAGLELPADDIDAFRRSFETYAREKLDEASLTRVAPVDAVVGSDALGMELAAQLERLGPFGAGNPNVRLLVPAARVSDVRRMGETEAHARFAIEGGARRAAGVAFDVNGDLDAVQGAPHDLGVRLEVNRWNGSEHPRAVLDDVFSLAAAEASFDEAAVADQIAASERPGCLRPAPEAEWWHRFDHELRADPVLTGQLGDSSADGDKVRTTIEAGESSTVARIAELVSSGASVLAVCADAARRRELAESAANPGRFGGGQAAVACMRCESAARTGIAAVANAGGLGLCDWGVVRLDPGIVDPFEHLVLVDPPPQAALESAATSGSGFLHRCWGSADVELSMRVYDAEWNPRPGMADVFRTVRGAGGRGLEGPELVAALAGSGRFQRSPESAARSVRPLVELGLLELETGGARSLRVVSSEGTQLEQSAAFRAYLEHYEEATEFLQSMRQPQP